jgi:methylated-DNA-[protein]-cysteine S-methyltransferase
VTIVAGFTLFGTPIGVCGIAWGPRGIVGVSLPAGGEAPARARMRKRFPDASETKPPSAVAKAIDRIRALLRGETDDLLSIELDMDDIPEFHRRVFELARKIAPGETLTYGAVAEKLNSPGAARAVGQALGANPFPIIVPCHRVLGAGGKTGGFSAPGGTATKMRMLSIEGAKVNRTPTLFDGLALVAPPRRQRTAPQRRR